MLCLNPIIMHNGQSAGCKVCPPCRINLKRIWSCRLQLENYWHTESTFVTLTYRDDVLPLVAETDLEGITTDYPIPSLNKEHLREFIKTLRNKLRARNSTFRYFACGEYGDLGEQLTGHGRPHYHLIIYGLNALEEEWLEKEVWTRGFVTCAEVVPERCSYVAGYTVKKMTSEDDRRLRGRWPEFALMSSGGILGGLGAPAVPWLARSMTSYAGQIALKEYGDVFHTVRIGGKCWPLGRYLRRKLREYLGIPNDFRERALFFDFVDHATGEPTEPPLLPMDYSPNVDVTSAMTPLRRKYETQEKIEQLPELLEQSERREAKRNRRLREEGFASRF